MKAIWSKELREVRNHTLAFHTKVQKTNNSVIIKLAASNLYRIFINGEFFAYGPARAAHGYSRIDEYDLSRFSVDDMHIVVEVYSANANSFYIVKELPFFAAKIISGNDVLASTEKGDFSAYHFNDRAEKIQRYSFQRPFAESYKFNQSRKTFYFGDTSVYPKVEVDFVDANKFINREVSYPTYEYKLANSIEFGSISINEDNQKWRERSLDNISDILLGYKFDELEECISDEACNFCYKKEGNIKTDLQEKSYLIYDFGRTMSGFFKLNVKINQKATIYIIWDEVITENNDFSIINFSRNDCCNVIKYELEPDTYELISFESETVRYANIVVVCGEIEIEKFGINLYENPDVKCFSYDTRDIELNNIIEAAVNTFAQNAVDILTDCPSRERAGWLCDSYFSSRAEKLFTGKNLVEKSFLENYIMSPQSSYLPEGMLPMCYPADHFDGCFIPNWSMWFVLELKSYKERTSDDDLVQRAKARVYNLINYFKKFLNEDGLLENLESWVFVEWSKCNDPEYIKGVNFPSNILYSAMLKVAGELYNDVTLVEQSSGIKQTIKKQSFNGEFFEENLVRVDGKLQKMGHLTETCQYYAFYFGTATKTEYPKLFTKLLEEFGPTRDIEKVYSNVYPSNAIVGNYLRLEILLQNKNYDQVLKECKEFFTQMAKLTGTLWEHNSINASLNHGFASVAANYIIESFEKGRL